jgi:uncharacterized protein (DUF58 family)
MTKLHKIKSKLNIHSRRQSILMLEGEYVSSLKGKSLDFDDLREYVYGDDVRDIDWRASAKQQTPLVKRYVANRRHNVLFVMDSSVTMLGAAPDYQAKYEIACEVIGLLGYLAVKHNDNVGLMTVVGDAVERVPYLSGEKHLNRILDFVEQSVQKNNNVVDVEELLRQVNLISRSRTIMIVIANEVHPSAELESIIKKLQNRHDVIWVSIADINPVTIPKNLDVMDVVDIVNIPEGLRADSTLAQKMFADETDRKTKLHDFLLSLRVSNAVIATSDEVVPTLTTVLKRRENGKRG